MTPWATLVQAVADRLSGRPALPIVTVAPRPADRSIAKELAAWAAERAAEWRS
jgi:hypothetical protein